MLLTRWLQKRKLHWDRFEELLKRARPSGVRRLAAAELRELGLLYRQTASDLASVREEPGAQQWERYLNQLLGRAHNIIYRSRRTRQGGIMHFYRVKFPRIFRETFIYTATAVVLFLVAGVVGFLLTLFAPGFSRFLLGGAMMDTIERREMWTHSIVSIKPAASSLIMTNNLMVAFNAFALGITGGLGTVYLMLFNGLLIGAIGTACWQAGMSVSLWSFVAPHGILELPAIFIAGGAGLLLGRGLLFPGKYSRRDSLVEAGGKSVRLLLGVIPLLIVAGVIEGFISPTDLAVPLKFALSGLLGLVLYAYLRYAGEPGGAG